MLLAAFYQQRTVDEKLAALPAPQSVYCGTNQFKPTGGLVPSPTPRPVHALKRGGIKSPEALADGTLQCIPGFSGKLQIADYGERVAAAGDACRLAFRSEERVYMAVDRQSAVAVISARVSLIHPTTSGIWARRRRIRNCSTGWL